MRKLKLPFAIILLLFLFLLSLKGHANNSPSAIPVVVNSMKKDTKFNAEKLYDSLGLENYGLSKKAWQYALKGYQKLLTRGRIENTDVITICDFSLSSRQKRLFVIDLKNCELLLNTYVAHGRKSGMEYAKNFSNKANSHQSSLGFYITRNQYYGENGLSLRLDGIEKGFNDKALKRNIVVHGSEYASDDFLNSNSFLGRSYGCPAVPEADIEAIVNTIKEGSCFFIYYPAKKYLTSSKILNG
ncbi:MAG: murein L,D-transpeptidase catalytic domain family protein [Bacteroidetes bacterium]|nr:murein L,D-transpeptidase catalytic domain family protein [Bacteroidota bacterium]